VHVLEQMGADAAEMIHPSISLSLPLSLFLSLFLSVCLSPLSSSFFLVSSAVNLLEALCP